MAEHTYISVICYNIIGKTYLSDMLTFINLSTMIVCTSMLKGQ